MDPKKAFIFCPKCRARLIKNNDHPKCPSCKFTFYLNPAPCNAVIIENENGEILLVKRKHDPRKGTWDLPGGFIEPNEDLITSVKREINEELHVQIKITGIIGIYNDTYLDQEVKYSTLVIIVKGIIHEGQLQPDDDVEEYKFFSKEEVLQQDLSFTSVQKGLEEYLKKC